MFFLCCLFLVCCNSLDDINNRLDKLETKITDLQSATDALQKAYADGKVIKSVSLVTAAGEEADGWHISFSDDTSITLYNGANGKTPYLFVDQDGYWCISYDEGAHFTRMMDNSGGYIKAQGEKGDADEEGVSIRVKTDEKGFYFFELYKASDPTTVIQTIVTPYNSDPSHLIMSIAEDNITHIVTLTMQDGTTFTFNKVHHVPTSVAILTNRILIGDGSTEVLENVEATIDGNTITINTPFILNKTNLVACFKSNGKKVYVGDKEQTSSITANDFSNPVNYTVVSENGEKKVYTVNLNISGLPVVYIDTPSAVAITSKEDWTKNSSIKIINTDGSEDYSNNKHIGNYYLCEQIKIDSNRLNIAKMQTTDVSGDALTGGYLMELDIYFDEVNKFKSATRKLPYMFKEPDEDILQPEQLAYFQDYINGLESRLYSGTWLSSREYASLMDLNTFADWWFVYELAKNKEPNHPKSCYMHKDRGGILKAGPVWDFDWGTYTPGTDYSAKSAIYYGRLFSDPAFVTIVKDRWATLKPRFDAIGIYIRTMAAQTKVSNEINIGLWPISSSVNGDEKMSFDAAIDRMVKAYEEKLSWLNAQITAM